MGSISPNTQLVAGTKVRVKGKLGEVVSAETVQAVPSGTVVVHIVRLTHKIVKNAGKCSIVELVKPVEDRVNYSFIELC